MLLLNSNQCKTSTVVRLLRRLHGPAVTRSVYCGGLYAGISENAVVLDKFMFMYMIHNMSTSSENPSAADNQQESANLNSTDRRNLKNLSDAEHLVSLGLSEDDAFKYISYRQMELDGLIHKSVIAQQQLADLRAKYGAELLLQVR